MYYKIDRKLGVWLHNYATLTQNSTLHKLIPYSIVDWKYADYCSRCERTFRTRVVAIQVMSAVKH